MATWREKLLERFEKDYQKARTAQAEELYNAIVDILNEHRPSIENALLVLKIIEMGYLEAKLREIHGNVILTQDPPLKKAKGK